MKKSKSITPKQKAQIVAVSDTDDSCDEDDSKKYKKMSEQEHVLERPDMYIGSVRKVEVKEFVVSDTLLHEHFFEVVPALLNLYNEILVNAADHYTRTQQENAEHKVSRIEVNVDAKTGLISVFNDGDGIDVIESHEHKCWIPELIFAHLRTSTNYDPSEKRIVGGKNGFGAKVVFIWSDESSIQTLDAKRGLLYTQTFGKNLSVINPPVIKKAKKSEKPYTLIKFRPDYERLGCTLSSDITALFHRRVYDIASTMPIKVSFNGVLVPLKAETKSISRFERLVNLFYLEGSDNDNEDGETSSVAESTTSSIGSRKVPHIYEQPNERWEFAVARSPDGVFRHHALVNKIHTSKGGKHVDYIIGKVVRGVIKYIQEKKKIVVSSSVVKENMFLFLNCTIENPSFDSQTKDYLSTPSNEFGSSCDVSDDFIKKVATKLGIMENACTITKAKEDSKLTKSDATTIKKTKSVHGIPKLKDANYAGTKDSLKCTLILTEGDSAKSGALSGMTKEQQGTFGIYPLKGKLMNTRGETAVRVADNKELSELKRIIGLHQGKHYTPENMKELRYGRIMILADQDLDGSHIKGLCINMFQDQWPSLSKIPGFLSYMNTPILRAKKGKEERVFYNEGEFQAWRNEEKDVGKWTIKYYKGLGTSTSKEFQQYFKDNKCVQFQHTKHSDNTIDMVFNKKRADERKEWLTHYNSNDHVDTSKQLITYEDFVNREMKHFSHYDCGRSIPGLDGLKKSLRKILYAMFKRNSTAEVKVAQLSGYVAEHSAYHHGEVSLQGAIIGMAQTYVGSNNINLLEPNGQFGTRLEGGKDSASPRYIFTRLSPITRHIFHSEDDAILNYLEDDGDLVEPDYYLPVIPWLLVNGAVGIGTGFSTFIPCYNVSQIIDYMEALVRKSVDLKKMPLEPYYEGFTGTIQPYYNKSQQVEYLIRGVYEQKGDTVKITELPIGTWTTNYKEFLEKLIEKNEYVRDYVDNSTDKNVEIIVTMIHGLENKMHTIGSLSITNVEKVLKLYTTMSTTNMHAFDQNEILKKYATPNEIAEEYYKVRLDGYVRRKAHLLDKIMRELVVLSNRARFISEILNEKIDLRRMKKDAVVALLADHKYETMNGDYKYLTQMPMDSVTEEKVEQLMKERDTKESERVLLESTTVTDIWLNDLQRLREVYKLQQTGTGSGRKK